MGDETRRKAEREARSGEAGSEAEVWVARLRAGEVERDRVRLAALLGSESARQALEPDEVPSLPESPTSADWASAYASLGQEVAARACLAVGRALCEYHHLIDEPTEKRLQLLESWLDKPTPTKNKRLGRNHRRESSEDRSWSESWQFPLREVGRELATIGQAEDPDALRDVMQSVVEAMLPIFEARTIMESQEELWKAVAAELEDWALGETKGETIESWEQRQADLAAAALERIKTFDFLTDRMATADAARPVQAWAEQATVGDLPDRARRDVRGALAKAFEKGSPSLQQLATHYAARQGKAAYGKLGEAEGKETREKWLAQLIAWAQVARGGATPEVWEQLDTGLERYRSIMAAAAEPPKPAIDWAKLQAGLAKRKPKE